MMQFTVNDKENGSQVITVGHVLRESVLEK
jgi:hypothetical protein